MLDRIVVIIGTLAMLAALCSLVAFSWMIACYRIDWYRARRDRQVQAKRRLSIVVVKGDASGAGRFHPDHITSRPPRLRGRA